MFFLGTVQLSFETKTEVISGGTGAAIGSYDNPSPIVTLKKSWSQEIMGVLKIRIVCIRKIKTSTFKMSGRNKKSITKVKSTKWDYEASKKWIRNSHVCINESLLSYLIVYQGKCIGRKKAWMCVLSVINRHTNNYKNVKKLSFQTLSIMDLKIDQ